MTSSPALRKHWNQGNHSLGENEKTCLPQQRRGNHLMRSQWLMSRRLAVHVSRMFDFQMKRPKSWEVVWEGGRGNFSKARGACLFWKPKGTLIDGNTKKQTASCLLVIFPQRLEGERRSLKLRKGWGWGWGHPSDFSCTENVMDVDPLQGEHYFVKWGDVFFFLVGFMCNSWFSKFAKFPLKKIWQNKLNSAQIPLSSRWINQSNDGFLKCVKFQGTPDWENSRKWVIPWQRWKMSQHVPTGSKYKQIYIQAATDPDFAKQCIQS